MITIKSKDEQNSMRKAGKVLGRLFSEIKPKLKAGVSTQDLDKFAEQFILSQNAVPAFKGYMGFPSTLCTSVNHAVVHGIPNDKPLEDGDIVGVDVGAIIDGFYADAARTFAVGEVSQVKQDLMRVAESAMLRGISQAQVGNRISDISHAIEEEIKPSGFGIVQQYVGHGIGAQLHEDPQIPNFGKPHCGAEIKAGMAFAIEPMVNAGTKEVKVEDDGWTVVTQDKQPSSHFENTILITNDGPEIVTKNV